MKKLRLPDRVAIYVYIFNRVHFDLLLRRSGQILVISFIVTFFMPNILKHFYGELCYVYEQLIAHNHERNRIG